MGMATSVHRWMCSQKSSSGFMRRSERISMESPFCMRHSSSSINPLSLSSRLSSSRRSSPPLPTSTLLSSSSSSPICGYLVLYVPRVSKMVSSLVSPCLPASTICMYNFKHIRFLLLATCKTLDGRALYPFLEQLMTLYFERILVTNCIIERERLT